MTFGVFFHNFFSVFLFRKMFVFSHRTGSQKTKIQRLNGRETRMKMNLFSTKSKKSLKIEDL